MPLFFRNMLIQLFRIQQWYKNLLIFLPLIFSGNLFNTDLLIISIIGFFALCLVSSSQYILNDFLDAKKDRRHPEKRNRPIASGKVNLLQIILIFFLTLFLGLHIAYRLDHTFGIIACILVLVSLSYTLFLKHEMIADILTISTNFVLRAISGAYLIKVDISPWLVLGVFFLATFLVTGKRHGEAIYLGKESTKIRRTLTGYTKELTNTLMIISTTLLILCYALYSFFSQHTGLLITLPFAWYTIIRYFNLVQQGHEIARQPERVIFDKRIMLGAGIWTILTFLILYKEKIILILGFFI